VKRRDFLKTAATVAVASLLPPLPAGADKAKTPVPLMTLTIKGAAYNGALVTATLIDPDGNVVGPVQVVGETDLCGELRNTWQITWRDLDLTYEEAENLHVVLSVIDRGGSITINQMGLN
jgi:hypothetical protein